MSAAADIIDQLKTAAGALQDQFAVRRLSVFGSVARGDARGDSDVDVLVEFDGRATFDRFMDLKFHLQDLLGREVDLVTDAALKPAVRATIQQEAVRVA